jgi:hypothetical protein
MSFGFSQLRLQHYIYFDGNGIRTTAIKLWTDHEEFVLKQFW